MLLYSERIRQREMEKRKDEDGGVDSTDGAGGMDGVGDIDCPLNYPCCSTFIFTDRFVSAGNLAPVLLLL